MGGEDDEDLLTRLSRQFPHEQPIKRSRYIPNCFIGKSRVWRGDRETITDTDALYPQGSIPLYIRGSENQENASLPARLWIRLSRLVMVSAGLTCKLILKGLNTTEVHGMEHLERAFARPFDVPLVTVFNHNSCFDDPGLMGAILSAKQLCDYKGMRWSVSATEVIYVNRLLSKYWALGKVVPITRGWGPNQPAIDFLLQRLNEGSWVNIFPEAKVVDNPSKSLPYRWGTGRLIMESKKLPVVVPVYHVGMNTVLPNPQNPGQAQPAVLRPGKLVTVCIGEPLDFEAERSELSKGNPHEAWSVITRKLEMSMRELEARARNLHKTNFINWCKSWHDKRDVYAYLLT